MGSSAPHAPRNPGKFGPLAPTYAPYCVKDPPQRPAVSDYRLSPSQRSHSCYCPEFLGLSCSSLGTRPATATAARARAEALSVAAASREGAAAAISPRSTSTSRSLGQATTSSSPASAQAARIYARAIPPRIGATLLTAAPHRALPVTAYSTFIKSTATSSFSTGGVFLPRSHCTRGGDVEEAPAGILVGGGRVLG